MGLKDLSFYKLVPSVFESLGQEYPDNAANASLAEKLLKLEEEKFRKTLDTGLALINEELTKVKAGQKFSGDVAFKLYDTFGFPLDLTEVILREKNLELDTKGFEEAMAKQKAQSKAGTKFKVQEDNVKLFYTIKEKFGETKFTGYDDVTANAKLIAKEEIDGKFYLVFDKTPFYGEGGGQLGDQGEIFSQEGKLATISDTQKPVDGLHVHISEDADALSIGETYTIKLNLSERELTKRNHSATHLLQSALIKVLGTHVKQAGSSVGPDRLRFDFTHNEALKPEEIAKVEELVNSAVTSALPVTAANMTKDQATKQGAMALFGEKYGDNVRVLTMGNFSCELCGGTHVKNTGEIGLFKIIVETSLASGVRRIEAITSTNAIDYLLNRSKILSEVEKNFAVKEERVLDKISSLFADVKDKNKQLEVLNDKLQSFESENLFNDQKSIKDGLTLTIAKAPNADQGNMRKLGDIFVDKFPKGVLFLYAAEGDKVSFIMKTHKTNTTIDCSAVLKQVMPIVNGRGGGKPDNAQGSGDAAKTQELIKAIEGAVK
jgi:alanyl-tRNA synthetase